MLGCLRWKGAKGRDGSGLMREHGKNRKAHRVYWERVNGPIPAGFDLRSTCKRSDCVEPAHRELRQR